MKCQYCGSGRSRVVDSRTAENSRIRRRRECLGCKRRFTTYEAIEVTPFMVLKRDGSRQSFDRNKLLAGLIRACEKRSVPIEKLEKLVNEIETELSNNSGKEVSTEKIGEMALTGLRNIDEAAYVRFASVYMKYEDIGAFLDEIKSLLKNKK